MLTLTATDPAGPQGYDVAVSGPGAENFSAEQYPADDLKVTLRGGATGQSTPGTYNLTVTVTGHASGLSAVAAAPALTLRVLGDIDGDGTVTAADKLEISKSLNGLATLPGIGLRELDLTGDGATINAEDKLIINQVLNGVAVP